MRITEHNISCSPAPFKPDARLVTLRLLACSCLAAVVLAACKDAAPPALEGPFVAVARTDTSLPKALTIAAPAGSAFAFAAAPPTDEQSFYLAVNRAELGQRWFLSAYLKQYYPGAVQGGAARSLGTRVVSFRVQNGKLFVFDASDTKTTSDLFDPQVLVDAYPIIDSYSPFNQLSNADQYVLIDPSAGLNDFNAVSDDASFGEVRFEVNLAFAQHFRTTGDGVTFEQVFTGYANVPIAGQDTSNAFSGSGTLALGLRRYSEGVGYVPSALPPTELYFRSDSMIIPNTGASAQVAVKWNVGADKKPIRWLIDPALVTAAAEPAFAGIDVVGAMKRGIENWNQVFGFTALTAEIAAPGDSFADDDKNYVLFDMDPSYGAAFANWRTNPNTGEIRGATVYFSRMWLDAAVQVFPADPGPGSPTGYVPPTPATSSRPNVSLEWGGMKQGQLCLLTAPQVRSGDAESLVASINAAAAMRDLTREQKVEAYITHVLVHEIGHTLGLRHNFKGSLQFPASSVMDYLLDEESIFRDTPGTFDTQAINYLYGKSTDLPTDASCTDENTVTDPSCNRFDAGVDPLVDFFAPPYVELVTKQLAEHTAGFPNLRLNDVLQYARAGTRQAEALEIALTGFKAPVDQARVAADSKFGADADQLAKNLFSRLYLDEAKKRGAFAADPKSTPDFMAVLLPQLESSVINLDGISSFATRRVCVDVLKKLQTPEAQTVLTDAWLLIDPEINNAVDLTALLGAMDLRSRIVAALFPYFN